MKTTSKILIATGLAISALLLMSCGTFITSNKVDEANQIKSWMEDSGYREKSNGFFVVRTANPDNTLTITKNVMFGNVDDAIVKGKLIADRVKPLDKYQQFECTVEFADEYYFIQTWKSYYFEEYDSNKKMIVPVWKVPYKSTYYIKKNQTSKDNFTAKLQAAESEFTMNYAQFLDNHNRMLKEYEDEQIRLAKELEAAAKADSLDRIKNINQ